MTSCVIDPQRNQGEPHLPATGILAVNPSDCSHLPALARSYDLQRAFLFNAQLYASRSLFIAGPAVGAPMAAICLEKLIALGATRILLYGWCGSLVPALRINDLFMPCGFLSEEGTSGHYPPPATAPDDSWSLALGTALTAQGRPPKQGKIWTTDAVFRETRDKVRRYGAAGIMAVDMEYAALRAVANFRQVSLAAVLLVSDELFHPQWTPQFQNKTFRSDSKKLLDRLCTLLHGQPMETI